MVQVEVRVSETDVLERMIVLHIDHHAQPCTQPHTGFDLGLRDLMMGWHIGARDVATGVKSLVAPGFLWQYLALTEAIKNLAGYVRSHVILVHGHHEVASILRQQLMQIIYRGEFNTIGDQSHMRLGPKLSQPPDPFMQPRMQCGFTAQDLDIVYVQPIGPGSHELWIKFVQTIEFEIAEAAAIVATEIAGIDDVELKVFEVGARHSSIYGVLAAGAKKPSRNHLTDPKHCVSIRIHWEN